MIITYTVRTALWLLLALGLFGALSLSYTTFSGNGKPCPDIGGIYICYVVLVSYSMMVLAQFGTWRLRKTAFYAGWAVTFFIAAVGTILELINGDTCPKSSDGLPMCYVSLALCMTILVLFLVHSSKLGKKGLN